MLFSALIQIVQAQQPNCESGRINFDPRRMYSLGAINETLDVSTYDMTIDYGSGQVRQKDGGGISVALIRAGNAGVGARLSTTRYLQYARITAKMTAVDVPGVVTTFITMSPRKDEIDWEFVGGETTSGQTNVFYKGILEFGVRSQTHATGPISVSRVYVIDWKSNQIDWYVDNRLVRTYRRDGPETLSPMTPRGERSYPTEPTQIQIGIWDGGSSQSEGTRTWAGGRIPWGDRRQLLATFDYIDIQCYNDKDEPVPRWPPSTPPKRDAPASQPTSAANANQGRTGNVGSGGSDFPFVIDPVEGLPQQPKNPNSAVTHLPWLFLFSAILI